MYVSVKTISVLLALVLGAYNIWPAIYKLEQVSVILGMTGFIVFTGLLYAGLSAYLNSRKREAYCRQDPTELLIRPIPYTFNHNGRSYDTSKAEFLGGFKQVGADYRGYTYHVDLDTKDAFCVEWGKLQNIDMLGSVYQFPANYYGGYDVWYDGAQGYQHAIEDVYDRCGAEAANLVEDRLENLIDRKLKPNVFPKTLGGGAVWT